MTELPTRLLFDTAVFVYAVGAQHPYRTACRELVAALADQRLDGEASVELVQELVHQRARRTGDRAEAVQVGRNAAALCTLHDVTTADLRRALWLFGAHAGLQARDAVHAATALERGIPAIVSPDRAFDDVVGLARLGPRDVARLLTDA